MAVIDRANIASIINVSDYWAFSFDSQFSGTVCVSAPAIAVRASVTSVLFRSASLSISASYWNGSSWVSVGTVASASKSGAGSSNSSWWFVNAADSANSYKSTSVLWKFGCSGSCAGSATYTVHIKGSAVSRMSQDTYDTYCKGQKIKYSALDYWRIGSSYTYSSTDLFLQAQSPSCYTGTKITSALAKNCCRHL